MRWLVCVALIGIGSACAEVKPWQRGDLTQPCMDGEHGSRVMMQGFQAHTNDVREGFSPCFSGQAGGGCGCN